MSYIERLFIDADGQLSADNPVAADLLSPLDRQIQADHNATLREADQAERDWDGEAEVHAVIPALRRLRAGEASDEDRAIVNGSIGGMPALTLPSAEELARRDMPPLSPWQFRAMLKMAGLEQSVVTAIAMIPDPAARAVAEAKLEYVLSFQRADPLFAMLGPAVGVTPEQIDTMWMQAAAL